MFSLLLSPQTRLRHSRSIPCGAPVTAARFRASGVEVRAARLRGAGGAVRAASRRATAARRARGRCGQGSPGVGRPGPGGAAAAARRARRAGRARRRERNRGGRRPAPGKAAPGWRPVDLEVGQRGCQATEVSSMGVPRRRRLLLLGRPPFLLLLGLRPRAWMLAGRLGASPLPRDAAPPLPWRRRTTARRAWTKPCRVGGRCYGALPGLCVGLDA